MRIQFLAAIYFSFFVFFSADAQSIFEKAELAFGDKEYFTAANLYEKAVKKKKHPEGKENELYYKIGTCYSAINKYEDAELWARKSIENGYEEPSAYLLYANMLRIMGNYELAKAAYSHYLKKSGDKSVEVKIASCDFALADHKPPIFYEVHNQEKINSSYSEYGLSMVNNALIFASTRVPKIGKVDKATGQGFSDIYEAVYDGEKETWPEPQLVKGGVNSKFNTGTFVYNEKTATAYFMQCNSEKENNNNCNIYYSNYNQVDKKWSRSTKFDYAHDQYSIGHPAITSDAKTLYFVSDMPGGMGGKDIWVIKKEGDLWSQPANLGAPVNTPGDEMFPYVAGDTMLYFSSNGHVGYGGLDIYYSKINKSSYGKPVNMYQPINSSADDFSILFTEQSLFNGYICSNRDGGLGEDDIYSFNKAPIILNAIGKIVNADNDRAVRKVTVYFEGNDGTRDSTSTNFKGEFNFSNLKPGVEYKITAIKKGFFNDSKELSTVGVEESMVFSSETGVDLDFGLIKMTKKEILIPHIYYEFDKADIKSDSKKELNRLVRILTLTPDVKVQISSHTDEIGESDYNMQLSQRRAKNVVDYLVSNGVEQSRIVAKGYGESQPIKKHAKTKGDHQLNRRTTLKILEE